MKETVISVVVAAIILYIIFNDIRVLPSITRLFNNNFIFVAVCGLAVLYGIMVEPFSAILLVLFFVYIREYSTIRHKLKKMQYVAPSSAKSSSHGLNQPTMTPSIPHQKSLEEEVIERSLRPRQNLNFAPARIMPYVEDSTITGY